MPENIHVDYGQVEGAATQIESAAFYLMDVPLTPQDTRTTISANAGGKASYRRSQERLSKLGLLLDGEVKNIRSLNLAFAQFDEMMGEFAERQSRFPVITAEE